MKKILNKKGFTMVELIVVVAILGLMLAIVVPLFSTVDARKDEVKDYARSFYSNVQELMVDEKIAHNPLPGTYTLVCVQVDEDNADGFNGVKIWMSCASTPSDFSANLTELVDTTTNDDKVVLSPSVTTIYDTYAEFATSLRKLLLTSERTGWYYAVVDDKYRVVSAYFVEGEGSDYAAVKGQSFTSDNALDSSYAGAWPVELAESGTQMFELPA